MNQPSDPVRKPGCHCKDALMQPQKLLASQRVQDLLDITQIDIQFIGGAILISTGVTTITTDEDDEVDPSLLQVSTFQRRSSSARSSWPRRGCRSLATAHRSTSPGASTPSPMDKRRRCQRLKCLAVDKSGASNRRKCSVCYP